MLIYAGILYCAGVQIKIQLFPVEVFPIVDQCRISLSPLQVIFYRTICTSTGFPVVLVLPNSMSASVEISDHGILSGDQALAIGHI